MLLRNYPIKGMKNQIVIVQIEILHKYYSIFLSDSVSYKLRFTERSISLSTDLNSLQVGQMLEMSKVENCQILADIINQCQDGIWSIDDTYKITAINPVAADLLFKSFGVNLEIGEDLVKFSENPKFDRIFKEIKLALLGKPFTDQESLFINEGERVFESSFSPIIKNGLVAGVSIISREITELSYFTRLGKSKFRELQVLNRLSAVITKAYKLDEMLEDCTRIAGESLSPSRCSFLILNKEKGVLQKHQSALLNSQDFGPIELSINQGISGWVARNGEGRFISDTRLDPDYFEDDPETLSELCVPIMVSGDVFGVINLESKTLNAFDYEDEQLLKTISIQIATSIERITLFEKTERVSREMSALYKTALVTGSELDSNLLLKRLYEQVLEFFRPDTFLLALYDHKSHEMELMMADSTGDNLPELTNKQLTLKETELMEWVMKTRQILITQELKVEKLPEVAVWGDDAISRSWLGTWLVGRDHLLGAISMQFNKPNAYDADHKRLLESMAGQVAIALENARLFEAENQRIKELAAISTLSLAMREARDRKELLGILLDELTKLVKADGISLIIKEPVSQQQFNEISVGIWAHNSGHSIPEELTISDEFWQISEPIVLNSLTSIESLSKTAWLNETNAIVGLPLSLQGETIGILWIGRDEAFTEEEIRILTALGDIAASAIRRTTLNDQTNRQLQQLASLHDIDLAITGSSDLKVTLDFLLGSALTQLEMDGAVIQSLNPFSQTLSYVTGRGIYNAQILRGFSRIGEDLAGICALERRMIQEPNLENAALRSHRARMLRDAGFNSYYATPLIAKGQVKGVLEVFNHSSYRVSSDWLNFFNMLSTQAAIAIDNGELFDNLQRSNMDLTVAYDSTLEGWANALELRDEETEGHARRVTEMTEKLALAVGVQGYELNNIRRGALLHDIGKMGIPDQILLKPGPLNDEEWKVMRTHPELAHKLIAPISYLRSAIDIPYCHHEKWDGSGYPRKLKRGDIPLSARLFAIIDVWDALSSDRPYRKAWPSEKVFEHLSTQSGTHFDPNIAKIFLNQVIGK